MAFPLIKHIDLMELFFVKKNFICYFAYRTIRPIINIVYLWNKKSTPYIIVLG